jgi:hypothetical protein
MYNASWCTCGHAMRRAAWTSAGRRRLVANAVIKAEKAMGVLNFIRTIFGYPDEPTHDYVASPLTFAELDIERMKRRMRLEEEGQTHGMRNEPATDSPSLDDIEQRIITTVESEKRLAYEKFRDHLKTYGDRIASLGFQTRFTQALAAVDNAISDFKAQVHVGADLLFHLRRAVVSIEDEIERFRQEHHLQRMPQYPQSLKLRWGFILLLLLIECILNGTFLARGHELGLLGGITEAFVIALMNIVIGLIAGRKIVPQILHRMLWRKLLGFFGIILYVVWLLGFNLCVAHYRYALSGEQPEQAPQLAVATLLAHPLGIVDIQAWLLFALGCLFSIGAAVDGWSMNDPYPGYGALARRQEEFMEDYAAQKQELMAELKDIRNAALENMELSADGIERRQAEYHTILEGRARIRNNFLQYLQYLEQCGNDLLATYRAANRGARSTAPPCHFSQPWAISRLSDPAFGEEGYIRNLELEAGVGSFFDQWQEKRQRVHAEYDIAVAEYTRIDELTREVMRDGKLQTPTEAADAKQIRNRAD